MMMFPKISSRLTVIALVGWFWYRAVCAAVAVAVAAELEPIEPQSSFLAPSPSSVAASRATGSRRVAAGRRLKGATTMMKQMANKKKDCNKVKTTKGRRMKGQKDIKGAKDCPTSLAPSSQPQGSPSASPTSICPGTTLWVGNGHRYQLIEVLETWNDANRNAALLPECCGKAAHLATLTSMEEFDYANVELSGDVAMWIGLRDPNANFTFEWVTGEPLNFTYFDPYPAAPGLCITMDLLLYGGFWIGADCNSTAVQYYSLVEYDC